MLLMIYDALSLVIKGEVTLLTTYFDDPVIPTHTYTAF